MRLPPFGRPLADMRRQGLRPASGTVIVLADHWPETKPERTSYPRVVLPADAEPGTIDWRFLSDLDALVLWLRTLTTPERLRALLRDLLAADPRRLIVIDREREGLYWVKSVGRGVELAL